MSRDLDRISDSSGRSFYVNSIGGAAALPVTIAGWFNPQTLSGDDMVFALRGSGANGGVSIHCTTVARAIRQNTSATNAIATTATTLLVDTWYHVAAKIISDTSHWCYINGTAGSEQTTSVVVPAFTKICIGCFESSGVFYSPPAFLLSNFGIWNVGLADAEISALADGLDPRLIRPASLQNLYRLDEKDANTAPARDSMSGGVDVTAVLVSSTGPGISGINPRIIRPPMMFAQKIVAAGASGKPTHFMHYQRLRRAA